MAAYVVLESITPVIIIKLGRNFSSIIVQLHFKNRFDTAKVFNQFLIATESFRVGRLISKDINLTDFFAKSFDINPVTDQSYVQIAQKNDYDYIEINRTEKIRENERLTKIAL